jgi:predicted membrane channel-forming protein YqfA (hemolysin III family)
VVLAASQYPLFDLFWTMLLFFGLAVLVWMIVVVFRDLFTRTDIGAGGKTLWVLAVLVFPIVGSLVYLISQSEAMGERRLQRRGADDLRMDSYLHTVSHHDSYRGVRDVTRTTQAWSGPIRPA